MQQIATLNKRSYVARLREDVYLAARLAKGETGVTEFSGGGQSSRHTPCADYRTRSVRATLGLRPEFLGAPGEVKARLDINSLICLKYAAQISAARRGWGTRAQDA